MTEPGPKRPGALARAWSATRRYFVDHEPTFWNALTPALVVAAVLFARSPTSNYIFDEQEALLANPYLHGTGLSFWQAFERDFWGLPPTRSIGSYRPIPNLVWRVLWNVHDHPWVLHWVNVLVHAVNASVLAGFALAVTKNARLGWLVGSAFLVCAVLTEAVTGVVGLADVLGGLGVLAMVSALRLRWWLAPLAALAAGFLGLLCKESVLVAVPILPWVALVTAPALHPERPWRGLRAFLALLSAVAALVGYTYLRRRLFPVELPAELTAPLPDGEPLPRRLMQAFSAWFRQPVLPRDPMNNPLVEADTAHRIAGALRVYARGVVQVLFPWQLSGDYSFPQEPVPERVVFPESVAGAVLLVVPPVAGVGAWVRTLILERRDRREARARIDHAEQRAAGDGPFRAAETSASGSGGGWSARLGVWWLVAIGLVWFPIAYFPHSNIPTLLPTVRAERFWYLPAMGTAFVLAPLLAACWRRGRLGIVVVALFFGFQAVRARMHAVDYTNDLFFWRSTVRAVPNSAKAHLNYGVMLGARSHLDERLAESRRALDLAPKWPMAHVYYADTLCRLKRPDEAWPHYARGFELAPNEPNLIALGLQCLWDRQAIRSREKELLDLARDHPRTWLAYLAKDIVYHGAEHGGVEKKYRPRGYDEGPKKERERKKK